MAPDTIVDKISKLLAKAESTTPEEAEALVEKATELMLRHAIDEAMVAAHRGEAIDEIVEKRLVFQGTYRKCQQDLAFAVGRGHGFRLIQMTVGNTVSAVWIGFKRDVERAEVLLASLIIQQSRATTAGMKAVDTYGWSAFEKFAAKRSFMFGFAEGVAQLLRKSQKAAESAAQAEQPATSDDKSSSVALVLASKQDRISEWYDKRYGKLRSGRATRMATNYDTRAAGYNAGRRADLGAPRVDSRRGLGR